MIEGDFHPDMIHLLPVLAITHGECGDPTCGADHWRVSIGWLVGSLHFYF